MKKTKFVSAGLLGVLTMAGVGCDSGNTSASTRPSPFAQYQPTSGQNLAPGIAPYAHGDPNWPMDAGGSGGSGGARR